MKGIIAMALSIFLAMGAQAAHGEAPVYADSVYLSGNIYTGQEKAFNVSALAIIDQMLVYVGDDEGAQAFIGPETNVVDLQGQTVIPGLIESHLHFAGIGAAMVRLDAFWKQKEDILALVAEEVSRREPGEWITGRGWNQEVWADEQFPSKEELDAVSPNNPVVLTRTCGHMIWANSMALEQAGVTRDAVNPEGGEYLRRPDGELLGVITDTAMRSVTSLIPPLSDAQTKEAMLMAQQQLLSYGITSAMDAGVGTENINLMRQLYESGDLNVRLYVLPSAEAAETFYPEGPQIGLYDGRMTIRAVKFMNDGSLGARSAWLLEDYSDQPGHVGNGRYTDDELYDLLRACTDAGFQIAVHSIGDAAVHQTIDTWARIAAEVPAGDYRPRIEHYQISTLSDIQRMADLGMVASMQFVHATSDLNMAEDRIGPERILGAYAWRKVLDAGIVLANGSDAPVESVNPFHGLYAGVARATTSEGLPRGGWYPAEAVTRYEALRSFTLHGAYAQFSEDTMGSLEVGKYADFVVIDRDYMTCATGEIKDIQALQTILGGEVVYTRD